MSFQTILDSYRQRSFSERDKGERFERLMQAYLKTDPQYANRFKEVWLWNEFPYRAAFGGRDTGIDLVALGNDGAYWAVQCKCYREDAYLDKAAVDGFLSTSGREFEDENGQALRFAQRLWISTTNKWSANANEALRNQNPPVARINLHHLLEAPVDWEKLESGLHGEAARTAKKNIREHQQEALDQTHEHFQTADRGKLIMACGTGKTFCALRIAEHETQSKGLVLFLVPSIALLGQSLREWSADAEEAINAICICSDPKVSKKRRNNDQGEAVSVVDLAAPASTDPAAILRQFEQIRKKALPGMTVVFSTYQSIDVVAEAQKVLLANGFPEFDLIICDEAHRTTGVSLAGEDESAFTKVHDNDIISARKRLYMTATPRLYSDDMKSKAAEADALLCSMDDPNLYGKEIYRIGFGSAVEQGLLTDYKVLILALSDHHMPPAMQHMIADDDNEISIDDASKLIGCINALSKQFIGDDGNAKAADPEPMRRAVAFCNKIATSKKISSTFNVATDAYLDSLPTEIQKQMVSVSAEHMDGSMATPERDQLLSRLKEDSQGNECRIITNVRVLSEGVDVPSLDAVLFLSARNSQVDVVQSVGRVMRTSPGKKYGYIIIPVVVPADVEADKALDDNERYKVVWTVLNALRAHDDRFNATINKLELNTKKPDNILVGAPEYAFDEHGTPLELGADAAESANTTALSGQLQLQFEQYQNAVFARMVLKVGDRYYWEQWAKDIAIIATRQTERIKYLIAERSEQRAAFDGFLAGLQKNINPGISETQAVDMLAQHIVTKPIFEALFEGYSFVKNNAVSTAMQGILDVLQSETEAHDTETLHKFYDSVRKRAEGIDNAAGKQRIIIELYDKFFRAAFPKMVEQLGIVYTPVEVVDFIIHSVNDVLKQEFGRSISDENIHILDPFTGTGTFITRLLQSGLIEAKDLARKYQDELHANEIVLLAYYIATVNIENAYHDQLEEGAEYEPFEGIVLTDTFQLGESDESAELFSKVFPHNSARVARQKKAPLQVIMGNPPYSAGQKSENDNAQNLSYGKLDHRIASTYAEGAFSSNKNALYDSYIRAFRWSTDRLDKTNGGVICFVSNSGWLDVTSTTGFRMSLEKEFTSIWVFDLRGNQRTKGELSRREGGKIFGSGSRTPIAITMLVKNPNNNKDKATIQYCDIGDYLNREDKLALVRNFKSVGSTDMNWIRIEPNAQGDWLNQRNDIFESFFAIAPDKKFNSKSKSLFTVNTMGVATNRDGWVYNSSYSEVTTNMKRMIDFYNEEVGKFARERKRVPDLSVKGFVSTDSSKISWSSSLLPKVAKGINCSYQPAKTVVAAYRPFFKQHLYFGEMMIHRRGQFDQLLPDSHFENLLICVSSVGVTAGLSVLISSSIADSHFDGDTQCFPLYYYEKRAKENPTMFDAVSDSENEYVRRDGVSDFILGRARKQYGKNVGKEDIFYYVYGILHSPDYRTVFANDLKKMLPRIPLVGDVRNFWKFSKAGRALAELHINYENVPAYDGVNVSGEESDLFTVQKMRFPKKGQTDTIIFNSKITISNIPAKAYEYQVNGKSAIHWIMERYQITTHKASGITNNPNDWAEEVGNPRYILDLLLSIINVSVQTVDIVNGLPKLTFE